MREMRDERDKREREALLGNNVHRISFLLQLSLSLSLSLSPSLSLSLSLRGRAFVVLYERASLRL